MKCHVHNCTSKAAITEEVVIKGKRMMLALCEPHYGLVKDFKEEEALKREQAAERLRWGDPQRVIR